MKKTLALLLVLMNLFIFTAFAEEINLSGYSYEQLIELQKQVNKEIMSRPEWKEVTVPVGTWKVGEDIPAGTYSVSGGKYMATMTIYKSAEKNFSDMTEMYTFSGMTTNTVGRITLKEGQYVVIEVESLTFAPPISLGF